MSSCQLAKVKSGDRSSLTTINLIATEDVNDVSALAIDVVFVFDVESALSIADISARDWFRHRGEFLSSANIYVVGYELPPISKETLNISDHRTRFPRAIQRVFVYADYLHENQTHSLEITKFVQPTLRFGKSEVVIAETK